MDRKRKAPTSGAILNKCKKYNNYLPTSLPSTALCSFLRRYREDLQQLPADKHTLRLINCCEYLLNEVGGQYHD